VKHRPFRRFIGIAALLAKAGTLLRNLDAKSYRGRLSPVLHAFSRRACNLNPDIVLRFVAGDIPQLGTASASLVGQQSNIA
jgi:hypothetical protein